MAGDILVKARGLVLDVFKFSKVSPEGVEYYILPDGTEVTIADIMRLLNQFPLTGKTQVVKVETKWGVSLVDILNIYEREGKAQLDSLQLEQLWDDWNKFLKTGNTEQFSGRPFGYMGGNSNNSWGNAISETQKLLKSAQVPYVSSPLGQEEFLKSFYPSLSIIDGNVNPAGWESALWKAAMDYTSKKTGKTFTSYTSLLNDPLGLQVHGLVADWLSGADMPKAIGTYPLVSEFYTLMNKYVVTPKAPEDTSGWELIGDEVTERNKIYLENYLSKMQLLYGDLGAGQAKEIIRKFLSAYPTFGVDETILGEEGKYPDLTKYMDSFMAFSDKLMADWKGKKLTDADKTPQQLKEEFLVRMQNLYHSRFGDSSGEVLFQSAMQQSGDLDLLTDGGRSDFTSRFAPEDMFNRMVPADAQSIWSMLGYSSEQGLNQAISGLQGQGFSPEQIMASIRQNTYNQAISKLQENTLSYASAETLRESLNQMIPFMPKDSNVTGLFLTETVAREDYRKWLLANLPEEPYKTNAWEYFPQVLSEYDKENPRNSPIPTQGFASYLSGMGTTFFARLSPKKEQETQQALIRPPGGGRLSLRQ